MQYIITKEELRSMINEEVKKEIEGKLDMVYDGFVDKACEWIKENMPDYVDFVSGLINEVDMANDFRKAMEE